MIRELTSFEQKNLDFINNKTIKSCVIIITDIGLKKSIMDATFAVRFFLKENNLHNYDKQVQGQDYKKSIHSYIFSNNIFNESSASLYRPQTKKGDPRIWFAGLKQFINSSCVIVLIEHNKEIYVFNITTNNIITDINNCPTLLDFFNKTELTFL